MGWGVVFFLSPSLFVFLFKGGVSFLSLGFCLPSKKYILMSVWKTPLSLLSLSCLVSLSSFIFLRTRGAPQKRRRRRRREGRGEDKDKDVDDDGDETDQDYDDDFDDFDDDDDEEEEEEHERIRVVVKVVKVVLVSPSTRRSSSFGRLKRDRVHELSPVDSATPIFNFNSHLSADDLEEFVFVHALGKPSRGRVEWKHGTGV